MMNLGTTEIILILAVLFALFLPVGLIILIIFVSTSSKKQQNSFKKSPFCAELIQPEAIVCRFCGRDIPK